MTPDRTQRKSRGVFASLDGYSRLVGFGLVLRVMRALLQFITYGLLVRLLTVPQFGVYAFLAAVIQVVCVPSQFGLPQLVLRDAARLVLSGDSNALAALARWARGVFLLTSCLGMTLAGLGLYFRAPSAVGWLDVCVALIMVPVIGLINLRSSQLRGMGYGARSQLAELFVAPLLFLLCVVVLFAGRGVLEAHVTSVLAVRLLALLLALIVANRLLRRAIDNFAPRYAKQDVRSAPETVPGSLARLKSSMVFGVSAGLYALNTNFDILAIAYLSGEHEVAMYKVAALVGGAVGMLMQSLNAAIGPVISRELALGNPEKLERLIYRQLRQLSLVVFAMFLLLAFAGDTLLASAFGSSYGSSYDAMLLLALASVVSLVFGPAGLLLNMGGHEQQALRASLVALITNIALNLVLVPRFGSGGAALATLLATLVFNVMLWGYAKRLTDINTLGWLRLGVLRWRRES